MKFLLFFMIISASVWAKAGTQEKLEIRTRDGVILKGLRLVNQQKPRILLLHGISETFRVFRFAQDLHDMGFDVFMVNSRGHGNGDERSINPKISPFKNQNGYYGFDNIVAYDVPAIIDAVYDGSQITIIGHSMGGAEARYFLSGARMGKNGIYQTQNKNEIKKYLNKVSQLITLGSPVNFEISNVAFKIWSSLFPQISSNLIMGGISRDKNFQSQQRIGNRISDNLYDKLYKFAAQVGPFGGIINTKNLNAKSNELGQLFLNGFSKFSVDFINDVQRWTLEGFHARSGFSYEGMLLPENFNFVQVAGSKDELVTIKSISDEHATYNIRLKPDIVELKGFSHIDLAASSKVLPIIYGRMLNSQCPMLFVK